MSSRKIKPLSRRSITCKECGKIIERFENLKIHYERKHPGKSCMVKGQSSMSTFVGVGPVGTKRKLDYSENLTEKDDTIESIPNKIQEASASIPSISANDQPLPQLSSQQNLDKVLALQTPSKPLFSLPSTPSTSQDQPQSHTFPYTPQANQTDICQQIRLLLDKSEQWRFPGGCHPVL